MRNHISSRLLSYIIDEIYYLYNYIYIYKIPYYIVYSHKLGVKNGRNLMQFSCSNSVLGPNYHVKNDLFGL